MQRWTAGVRYIPQEIDRAKVRTTLHYRLTPRVQIGIEYNPLADEVKPLANVHLLSETVHRPAMIFNTSTDRIGTPEGQSFTLTVSKDLKKWTGFTIAPYAGVAYGTYEDKARIIGGLYTRHSRNFSSTLLFDGVKVHPLVTYSEGAHSFSFLLAKMKRPGFSYSFSF